MYFSQGLEVVQTKRHKETRQSISHKLWLRHFYSLKAIDIFCKINLQHVFLPRFRGSPNETTQGNPTKYFA